MAVWPSLVASESTIQQAKALGRQKEQEYASRSGVDIEPALSEAFWVREVGQAALNGWLKRKEIVDFRWTHRAARHLPDFIIQSFRCNVYDAGCPIPVTTESIVELDKASTLVSRAGDYYFFFTYDQGEQRVWLLGGTTHGTFIRKARHYPHGAVNPECEHGGDVVITNKYGIYSLQVKQLLTPDELLYELYLRQLFNAVPIDTEDDE